jgi:hypothetical protein
MLPIEEAKAILFWSISGGTSLMLLGVLIYAALTTPLPERGKRGKAS